MISALLNDGVVVPQTLEFDWMPPGMLVFLNGQYRIEGPGRGFHKTDGKAFMYVKNELVYDDQFYVIRNVRDSKKLSHRHLLLTMYFLADDKLVSQTLIEEITSVTQVAVDDKIDLLKFRLKQLLTHS